MARIYAWEQACIGCHLCELACVVAQVGSSGPVAAYRSPVLPAPRLRVVEATDGRFSFATTCHQCQEPLCLYSCLTGALYRDEEGMVRVDQARCVGCWTCVLACPFGAIRPGVDVFTDHHNTFSSARDDSEHGLVSVKCDLCRGRRERPACVDACPNGALALADHVPARWPEVTQIIIEQLESPPERQGDGSEGLPYAGVTAGWVTPAGEAGRKEAGSVA